MIKKFGFLDRHCLQPCRRNRSILLVFDVLRGRSQQDIAVNRFDCEHALSHLRRRAEDRVVDQISGLLVEQLIFSSARRDRKGSIPDHRRDFVRI